MSNDYFSQRAFIPTLLFGIPILSVLCAAGGLLSLLMHVYTDFDAAFSGGALPTFSFTACLLRALWLSFGTFAAYLGGRFLLALLGLRLGMLYPLAGAAVAAFMNIRLLRGFLGSFGTLTAVWSVVLFVAWFAVLDSLEPERGARWRTVLLSLLRTKRRFR